MDLNLIEKRTNQTETNKIETDGKKSIKEKAVKIWNHFKSTFCPQKLFYYILLFFIIFSIVLVLFINTNLTDRGFDAFMDFFNHMIYSKNLSNTYFVSVHACFPALSYLFYHALGRFFPENSFIMYNYKETTFYAVLFYIIFSIIICIALCYCIVKILRNDESDRTKIKGFGLTLLLIVSSLFIYTIERGNSVLLVLIMLLFAVHFKDSNSKIKREISLILIAVATGFKIYPAVFGFLYLKEKRYREIIRLIIYGVVFFFLPFVFTGGFPGFLKFIENQKSIQNGEYLVASDVNIHANLSNITVFCNLIWNSIFHSNAPTVVSLAIIIIFVGSALSIVCFSKQSFWKKLALLVAIMIIVPKWSGGYTSVYLVIPLVYFLKDLNSKKSFSMLDWVYAALFALIFLFFEFDFIDTYKTFGNIFSEVIRYFAMYAILILILFESFWKLINKRKTLAQETNRHDTLIKDVEVLNG